MGNEHNPASRFYFERIYTVIVFGWSLETIGFSLSLMVLLTIKP